jgi:acetate kinase
VEIDENRNRAADDGERRISSGPVEVWVIPTNEELEIAADTTHTLESVR